MTEYTNNEMNMLKAFYDESVDCCGHCGEDENMSYMNANDLLKVLNVSAQSIGGTMSSLQEKGAIQDTGESARGSRLNDWVINGKVADELFNK